MKNNLIAPLRSIPPIRRALSAISILVSLVIAFAAFGSPVTTAWTYQGQLRRSGAAYDGSCNFQFSLWDAASAGAQQGQTRSINGVNVVNGLFTVVLDFGETIQGDDRFSSGARWLETSVQCSGDGGFTPLDPRQPITATPYALSLRPGATSVGNEFTTRGATQSLFMSGPGTHLSALVAANFSDGNGVDGYSKDGAAIRGVSTGSGPAISGEPFGTGFAGHFFGPVKIESGKLTVVNDNDVAIAGTGSTGVSGVTNYSGGTGVYGQAAEENSAGVFGLNWASAAIWGRSHGVGPAIYGENTSNGYAGRFKGPVLIEGHLIVGGHLAKSSGTFKIDHPLDPANKFLSHSFVESPDMKNIYDGNVTTDATGSAIVTLPDYFEALNRDYRYQLTVLGQFAQAIVSREIAGNSFEIQTDKPGVKVSWLVTGIRQDAYARANPIVVEEAKPAEEQGLYLYPAGFGAGEEKQIGASSRPETPQN
jgi:hypothetical protein